MMMRSIADFLLYRIGRDMRTQNVFSSPSVVGSEDMRTFGFSSLSVVGSEVFSSLSVVGS